MAVNNDFRILRINPAMQAMLGWQAGDDVRTHLANIENFQSALQARSKTAQQYWQDETELAKPNGESFIAELRLERLPGQHSKGHLLLVAEDITERKQHEQRLHYLSRHDHLTDIPNRLSFNEQMSALLSQCASSDRYALILADLDDFKTINDSHGHNIGDLLLKEVAGEWMHLMQSVPEPGPHNIAARHSGDEFLMLIKLPKTAEAAFETWLQLTQATLAQPRTIANTQVRIKASMGISFWPDNSRDGQMLLQQADMAMYQAKKQSKGGYAYFSEKLDIDLKRLVELENAILLQQGYFGLEVFYQPKVDTATGLCTSAEALSRWRLASGELLMPGAFLPLIRPGEMDRQFNLAIIRQVCRDLAKFQAIRSDFSVSINVSPTQLETPEFLQCLMTIVDTAGLNPRSIILEILEDAGISNDTVLENLRLIREHGFKISIDDFGTGYSSLSHLNRLTAHELKIDRAFLNAVPGDATAEKLYLNIIELAKRFDLTIVCEGVETPSQLEFIKHHGCHHYQGYLFSPALPLAQFLTLVENQKEPA